MKETLSGHYLGTEIEGRRYRRDRLFARGNGRYWFDEDHLCFRRYLTRQPIVIPLARVQRVEIGTWHAGRWAAGIPIVKLVWLHEDHTLVSGFLLAKDRSAVDSIVDDLGRRIALARGRASSSSGEPPPR